MTRPTLPGLVAEWNEAASASAVVQSVVYRSCAAELSQAVALTQPEQDSLAWMDDMRAMPSTELSDLLFDAHYDTLRALVTRLTAASDGGVKGENHE